MALVFPGYDNSYDAYNPYSMSRRPSMYGGGSSYAYDQAGYHDLDPMYGGVRQTHRSFFYWRCSSLVLAVQQHAWPAPFHGGRDAHDDGSL